MSIESDHLTEARRDTDHAAMDLAYHIERPLRRAALKLRASRVESMLCWERNCCDAEVRRQQKLIAKLRTFLHDSAMGLAERDQRIAALEQQTSEQLAGQIMEHLIEQHAGNITDHVEDAA